MEATATMAPGGVLMNGKAQVGAILPADAVEVKDGEVQVKPGFFQRLADRIKARREERRLRSAEKDTAKAMDQIRDELICEAFGLTPDKLKEFRKVHERIQQIDENINNSGRRLDVLELNDSLAVYNAKDKTAGRALTASAVTLAADTAITVASGGTVTSVVGGIAAILGAPGFIPIGQVISLVLTACLGVFGLFKLIKSRKGKSADRDEQGRAFDEKYVKTILEPLKAIEPKLQVLKNEAVQAKLKMKKDEFYKWLKNEMTDIFKELNIGNFAAEAQKAIDQGTQEVINKTEEEAEEKEEQKEEEQTTEPNNKRKQKEPKIEENVLGEE